MKINLYFVFLILLIVIIANSIYRCLNKDLLYFKENGYLLFPEEISSQECDQLFDLIQKELKNENKTEGGIQNPKNRKDLLLPVNDLTKSIIKKIYKKYDSIWKNVTPTTILAECSSFISYPGSEPQIWHADILNGYGRANLITIGIALKDIDDTMGPLEVYPKSNNLTLENENVNFDNRKEDKFLEEIGFKSKKLSCKKGSIIIWDSEIYHRGGANKSNQIRPIFYFSFLEGNKPKPNGATYSLKETNKKIFVKDL